MPSVSGKPWALSNLLQPSIVSGGLPRAIPSKVSNPRPWKFIKNCKKKHALTGVPRKAARDFAVVASTKQSRSEVYYNPIHACVRFERLSD